MKKFLKWAGIILSVLLVAGFFAFLYLIPPFTLAPPEAFSEPEKSAAPSLDHITDPAKKLIAERGKYLVSTIGCTGCHTSGGEKGPQWDKFLAGGMKFQAKEYGTVISRNITPDPTGIGNRSDEYLNRILLSGVIDNNRISIAMPWPALSNLNEEDRYAIIQYMRNLKSVHHEIPAPLPTTMPADTKAGEIIWGGDYANH